MKNIPAYKLVYSELRQKILDKTILPGSFLPTENELCDHFSVSKTTIRKAISLLVQDGYIQVTQGRGTEVLDRTATQTLNSVSSFTETLLKKGYDVSTSGGYADLISADSRVATALALKEGDPVYHIQRIQCADNKPIAIMDNYLTANIFPDFYTGEANFISLYAMLEKKYNLQITKAEETLMAAPASFLEAQVLNISPGSALLISHRVTYSDDTPFDFSILKIRGDKYSYSIHLVGR